MIAVIYDPVTGKISQTIQGSQEAIQRCGDYIEVKEYHDDYDSKYVVKDGALVAIEQ